MDSKEYAETYEKMNEWILKNAPSFVLEGINFILQHKETHIKLLINITKLQDELMSAITDYQAESMKETVDNEELERKKQYSVKICQRITFFTEQLEAFQNEFKKYKKKE